MKKMFAVVLVASIALSALGALGACHGKKPGTAPASQDKALEHKDDATGGASYGGRKTDAQPGKETPNPSAPH